MHRLHLPLSVAVLTLSLSLSTSALASPWLPLDEGNTWTFEGRATTAPTMFNVEASWGPLYYVQGLSPGGNWLMDLSWFGDDNADVYIWNEATGCWDLFVPSHPTRPWTVDLSTQACDTYEVELLPEPETYTTPAGRFHDARTTQWSLRPEPNVRCRPPALSEVALAENAGPIRFVDGSGYASLLLEAELGDRVLGPDPAAWVSSGSLVTMEQLDANLYVNEHNTIYCVRAPCPSNQVNAVMTVDVSLYNDGDKTLELTTPTAQWFDVALIDIDGRVVRSWSDDQVFTQSTRTIVIPPGHTYDATVEMELVDTQGAQLEGRYTAEAWIIGLDAAVDVDFDIDVVPSEHEPDLDQSR